MVSRSTLWICGTAAALFCIIEGIAFAPWAYQRGNRQPFVTPVYPDSHPVGYRCYPSTQMCEKENGGPNHTEADCETSCWGWACSGNTCSQQQGGPHTSKQDCESTCWKWECGNNYTCVQTENGTYSYPNCTATCVPPPVTTYACEAQQCVLNASGVYANVSSCEAACVTTYACTTQQQCVLNASGVYANASSCESDCWGWSCVNDACVQEEGGSFANNASCTTACDEYNYTCSSEYECVINGTGNFDSAGSCAANCTAPPLPQGQPIACPDTVTKYTCDICTQDINTCMEHPYCQPYTDYPKGPHNPYSYAWNGMLPSQSHTCAASLPIPCASVLPASCCTSGTLPCANATEAYDCENCYSYGCGSVMWGYYEHAAQKYNAQEACYSGFRTLSTWWWQAWYFGVNVASTDNMTLILTNNTIAECIGAFNVTYNDSGVGVVFIPSSAFFDPRHSWLMLNYTMETVQGQCWWMPPAMEAALTATEWGFNSMTTANFEKQGPNAYVPNGPEAMALIFQRYRNDDSAWSNVSGGTAPYPPPPVGPPPPPPACNVTNGTDDVRGVLYTLYEQPSDPLNECRLNTTALYEAWIGINSSTLMWVTASHYGIYYTAIVCSATRNSTTIWYCKFCLNTIHNDNGNAVFIGFSPNAEIPTLASVSFDMTTSYGTLAGVEPGCVRDTDSEPCEREYCQLNCSAYVPPPVPPPSHYYGCNVSSLMCEPCSCPTCTDTQYHNCSEYGSLVATNNETCVQELGCVERYFCNGTTVDPVTDEWVFGPNAACLQQLPTTSPPVTPPSGWFNTILQCDAGCGFCPSNASIHVPAFQNNYGCQNLEGGNIDGCPNRRGNPPCKYLHPITNQYFTSTTSSGTWTLVTSSTLPNCNFTLIAPDTCYGGLTLNQSTCVGSIGNPVQEGSLNIWYLNGRCKCECPPPVITTYTCESNGMCVLDAGGEYSNITSCDASCVQLWPCDNVTVEAGIDHGLNQTDCENNPACIWIVDSGFNECVYKGTQLLSCIQDSAVNSGTETMAIFYNNLSLPVYTPCSYVNSPCGACQTCYGNLNVSNGRRYQVDDNCCTEYGCASKEAISQSYVVNGLEASTLECHDGSLTTLLTDPKNELVKFPGTTVPSGMAVIPTWNGDANYYGCNGTTISTEAECNLYPHCLWNPPMYCVPIHTIACPTNFGAGVWVDIFVPITTYTCESNGTCVLDAGGEYSNITSCDASCVPSPSTNCSGCNFTAGEQYGCPCYVPLKGFPWRDKSTFVPDADYIPTWVNPNRTGMPRFDAPSWVGTPSNITGSCTATLNLSEPITWPYAAASCQNDLPRYNWILGVCGGPLDDPTEGWMAVGDACGVGPRRNVSESSIIPNSEWLGAGGYNLTCNASLNGDGGSWSYAPGLEPSPTSTNFLVYESGNGICDVPCWGCGFNWPSNLVLNYIAAMQMDATTREWVLVRDASVVPPANKTIIFKTVSGQLFNNGTMRSGSLDIYAPELPDWYLASWASRSTACDTSSRTNFTCSRHCTPGLGYTDGITPPDCTTNGIQPLWACVYGSPINSAGTLRLALPFYAGSKGELTEADLGEHGGVAFDLLILLTGTGDWSSKFAPSDVTTAREWFTTGAQGFGPPAFMFVLSVLGKSSSFTFYQLSQSTINRNMEMDDGAHTNKCSKCWGYSGSQDPRRVGVELDVLETPFWNQAPGTAPSLGQDMLSSTVVSGGMCLPLKSNAWLGLPSLGLRGAGDARYQPYSIAGGVGSNSFFRTKYQRRNDSYLYVTIMDAYGLRTYNIPESRLPTVSDLPLDSAALNTAINSGTLAFRVGTVTTGTTVGTLPPVKTPNANWTAGWEIKFPDELGLLAQPGFGFSTKHYASGGTHVGYVNTGLTCRLVYPADCNITANPGCNDYSAAAGYENATSACFWDFFDPVVPPPTFPCEPSDNDCQDCMTAYDNAFNSNNTIIDSNVGATGKGCITGGDAYADVGHPQFYNDHVYSPIQFDAGPSNPYTQGESCEQTGPSATGHQLMQCPPPS